jgi:hypothetical protein
MRLHENPARTNLREALREVLVMYTSDPQTTTLPRPLCDVVTVRNDDSGQRLKRHGRLL